MLVNAAANMFVVCRYPEYEEAQRKDAQSEIQDYLAANPAFAKQFLEVGVNAGAEILKNNPGTHPLLSFLVMVIADTCV